MKTLHDKRINIHYDNCRLVSGNHYPEKDVKKFIKELKESITPKEKRYLNTNIWDARSLITIIDKLAGDKLI